jgi:hypothetical protein
MFHPEIRKARQSAIRWFVSNKPDFVAALPLKLPPSSAKNPSSRRGLFEDASVCESQHAELGKQMCPCTLTLKSIIDAMTLFLIRFSGSARIHQTSNSRTRCKHRINQDQLDLYNALNAA